MPYRTCAARRRHALAALSVCLHSIALARIPRAEAATLPPPPPVGNCPDCLGASLRFTDLSYDQLCDLRLATRLNLLSCQRPGRAPLR